MKRKLKIFIILLIGFQLCACSHKAEIKVMTWNIWHGGLHGSKADNFQKDTVNTLNILKVIEQNDPDIILMQETYCCGMGIAKEAGYHYSWRASSNLSIHSKYPITDTINIYKPFNSQGVIIDVDGEKLMCFNLWLHYLPDYFNNIKTMTPDSMVLGEEKTRLSEIRAILKEINLLGENFDGPIILGGDLNSGSHLDWIESTKKWHYNKIVEWPVSKLLLENGFIDSFREANTDPLQTMDGIGGFLNDEKISDRIDYIYYKGKQLKTKTSRIVKEDPPGGFFNSDHRAIISVFYMN